MNWNQAEKLLRSNIYSEMHLSPNANFKIVREVSPYKCKNYNFGEGFRVQVGAKNEINVTIEMLKVLFENTRQNNNTYNRAIYKESYPRELNNKPCYVHSVGKLFEWARVMQL